MTDLLIAVLNLTISGGVAAGIVWILRLFLRRMPGVYSYILWLLVFFRFASPFTLETALSLFPVNRESVEPDIVYEMAPAVHTGIGVVDRAANSVLQGAFAGNPQGSVNPLQVALAIGTLAWAAGIAVSIPLSKRYYLSAVFAYIVSAGLGFLVGDVTAVAGYAVYFGPMALISAVMWEKKVKWFISYPVKIVYINAALAVLYFALQGLEVLAPDIIGYFDYWAIAILGTVALLIVDLFTVYVYRTLRHVLVKVLRDKHTSEVTEEEIAQEDEENKSPFDELDD